MVQGLTSLLFKGERVRAIKCQDTMAAVVATQSARSCSYHCRWEKKKFKKKAKILFF